MADFVPLASTTTVVDEDEEHLVFAGRTLADGDAGIAVLVEDTFELEYMESVLYDGFELVWEASVSPSTVTVGEREVVDGVTWTIEAATCEAVD